jgi:hypothetical protein
MPQALLRNNVWLLGHKLGRMLLLLLLLLLLLDLAAAMLPGCLLHDN